MPSMGEVVRAGPWWFVSYSGGGLADPLRLGLVRRSPGGRRSGGVGWELVALFGKVMNIWSTSAGAPHVVGSASKLTRPR